MINTTINAFFPQQILIKDPLVKIFQVLDILWMESKPYLIDNNTLAMTEPLENIFGRISYILWYGVSCMSELDQVAAYTLLVSTNERYTNTKETKMHAQL